MQDALHRGEVRLPGFMHMKANLLNNVGDVRAGERQILKGPGEASELSWINNRRPKSNGDLDLRIHGHLDRLTVHHASLLKDVQSKLALSKEESIDLMLYGDKKMVCCRRAVLDAVSTMSST
jgi:hypothetical protein